jgi:hypothetical protein
MNYHKPLILSLVLLMFSACSGAGQTPSAPQPPGGPDSPAAYVVSGTVVNTAGQPVADADITLRSGYAGVGDIRAKSGADGRYQVNIPEGSWIAQANKWVSYHNRTYCLSARPNNTEPIWANTGAVRDFTLVTHGENPRGGEPYGGELNINVYLEGATYGSAQTVVISLTPEGPLLDGSQGITLQGPLTFTYEQYSVYPVNLYDLPLGRYRVSAAWQQADGSLRSLVATNGSSDSPDYKSDIVQFDGGMMACDTKHYNVVELTTAGSAPVPGNPSESAMIRGSLTAPAGHSLQGSYVIACPLEGGCDAGGNAVQIEATENQAIFEISELTAEAHAVFAWKDVNGNDDIDEGDLLGIYTLNGEDAAAVTPPASNIQIVLEVIQGPTR